MGCVMHTVRRKVSVADDASNQLLLTDLEINQSKNAPRHQHGVRRWPPIGRAGAGWVGRWPQHRSNTPWTRQNGSLAILLETTTVTGRGAGRYTRARCLVI